MATSNVKIEPKEVFFYLDKLVRKIKIKNLNEHPIKFELLTVLNERDLSPLQSNETQGIIQANQTFIVSLEYKDSKEQNCDSIIILTIYNLIDKELIESEPIHVPFHFRNLNLVNVEENLIKKDASALEKAEVLNRLSDESDNKEDKLNKSDQTESPTKIKKKSLFKKQNKIENIFKLNKGNDAAKEQQKSTNDQAKDLSFNEAKDRKLNEHNDQTNKKDKEETTYNDDISICDYNQVNSLRFEDDKIRKYAKLIFLITFFNFCYAIFLTFISPLNRVYNECINNYNLNSIAQNCTSTFAFNQLVKNYGNKDD